MKKLIVICMIGLIGMSVVGCDDDLEVNMKYTKPVIVNRSNSIAK